MEWAESITVERPITQVFMTVSDLNELMAWSTWPNARDGSSARVEGDGISFGSAIVLTDHRGVEQGRQQLTGARLERVEYQLRNRAPVGRELSPSVVLRLQDVGASATIVTLDFHVDVPLPLGARHLAESMLGRRLRAQHVRDLQQLKAHLEAQPVRR